MCRAFSVVVAFVLMLALMPLPADAAVSLGFTLKRYRDLRDDPAAADQWLLAPELAANGSIRSANGLAASERTSTGGTAFSHAFASWDEARAEAEAGPWTVVLTGATPAQTSTYSVVPDFSGVTPATFATSDVLSPTPNQILRESQPTFAWTAPPGSVALVNAAVLDQDERPITFLGLSPRTTAMWELDEPLPSGWYSFHLALFREASGGQRLPVSATLQSGPDRGAVRAEFSYFFESATPFDVAVPEPSAAVALSGVVCVLLRRRRPT